MEFPLCFDDVDSLPRKKNLCLTCGHQLHDIVVSLSGGAFWMDRQHSSGGLHDRMEAFLTFHKEMSGEAERVEVVSDILGGQFQLLFCSSACCKSFLNTVLDELDTRMAHRLKK